MTQCINPDCLTTNLDTHRFCQRCGKPLWLKDRYQALNLIGQGGFGKTFLAVDQDKPSKPLCVIKQFFPQLSDAEGLAKAEQLFTEEAKRLDELGHHDQIPSLLAYFSLDNRQYLVQEYIEGQNLEVELEKSGVFSQEQTEQLLLDLLPVLDFIHHVPVIHRDIKPENIIRRTKDEKVVLVDFGASKLITNQNRCVTGTIIGSAEYAAPEQVNGKVIPASDLYSLGVTCLYLLTGISPFELFDSEDFEWVWQQKLSGNPVKDDFAHFLERLISPGTKKRYQTAKQALEDLINILPLSERNKNQSTSVLNSNDSQKSEIFGKLSSLISKQLEIPIEEIKINTKIFEILAQQEQNKSSQTTTGSIGGIWGSLFPPLGVSSFSSGQTKLFSGN